MFALISTIYESKWTRRIVAGLAGLGCLHFGLSFYLWARWCTPSWPEWANEMIALAWPVVGLFTLAAVAFMAAILGKRWSILVLVLFFIASASAFTYDIVNERWQGRVSIATVEYWEDGGKEYYYLTWWWYG
ncbi:MAG: hypothetical protein HQ567_28030 [Candidatus Nealsonbacteria bacterium]|nr:hypothetical protein [Candidatus Nealsonbacteria bacterium]